MPLPCVTTFLLVTLDEGKGVCAYARAAGMHRSSMSRYLHDISDKTRNGAPGLGLVAVAPHPASPRRRQVLLTAKGRLVAQQMFVQIRRASDAQHRRSDTSGEPATLVAT